MKITFPHLGNAYIASKILFDSLGIDYVIPPISNKEGLRLGSLHSPDEMCLPFKIMIGNYIQSINQGADTVLIVGSCGPCRFGEYCELQMVILKKLGYDINFIVIDNPKDIGKNELMKRLSQITAKTNISKAQKIKAALRAYNAICLIDEIERLAYYYTGYEAEKGQCKRILNECKKEVVKKNNPVEAIQVLKHYYSKINNVTIDRSKDPIKISLIGEIYTNIEPFANMNIEDKLMDYGVSSHRSLSSSWWVKYTLLSVLKLNAFNVRRAANPYLPYNAGGYAKETIGEAILSKKKGFDGAIQLLPVGCMPEIVTKSILPSISKDKEFPIMTLIMDEMTGEAGYITRIEAFVDLLERRREHVLSWC